MGRGLDGFFDTRGFATAVFKARRRALAISGGFGEGETPLPIPNREVKPLSADGTWSERTWESRTPPVFLCGPPAGGPSSLCPLASASTATRTPLRETRARWCTRGAPAQAVQGAAHRAASLRHHAAASDAW